MAWNDDFVLVSQMHDRPFITLRNRSVTFSKAAVEALEYPAYVHMFVDRKGYRAAFAACDKDENAIPFYRAPEKGRSMLVRISDRQNAAALMKLAGIDDCGKGIRYYGEYLSEEKVLIIDFRKDPVKK